VIHRPYAAYIYASNGGLPGYEADVTHDGVPSVNNVLAACEVTLFARERPNGSSIM